MNALKWCSASKRPLPVPKVVSSRPNGSVDYDVGAVPWDGGNLGPILHVHHVTLRDFKRFTQLDLDLPEPSRLVMLCGPNGTGKSSLFEAFKSWQALAGPSSLTRDREYLLKGGANDPGPDVRQRISLTFHGAQPIEGEIPRAMYFRTAYRNEASFLVNSISHVGDSLVGPAPGFMINNDSRVSDNYQRLAAQAFTSLFDDGDDDDVSKGELRERLIGRLSQVVRSVLPDLVVTGMGSPFAGGTFRFTKGISQDFAYMNLSGGEKAVFDLLLDLTVKSSDFAAAVIGIDEPEAHTSPRVQARLLDAMLDLAGPNAQLWLATHSISMLRRAQRLSDDNPGSVAFLDFSDRDFDQPQTLTPVALSRSFWKGLVATSLGDVADLVAPLTLVLCEGQPSTGARSEFDPRCLRAIFGEHLADVDFIGIGGDKEVIGDQQGVGRAVQTVTPGTKVIRLVDRDDRESSEVEMLRADGVTVLTRRNLESYLLDEEVIERYCASLGKPDKWPDIKTAREAAIRSAIEGGKASDDWKAAKGDIYNACRAALGLTQTGSNADIWMATQLAPLIEPGMTTYDQLRADVFG